MRQLTRCLFADGECDLDADRTQTKPPRNEARNSEYRIDWADGSSRQGGQCTDSVQTK